VAPHRVRLSKKSLAQVPANLDVVIVGSGLGALTVGSLLSQRGYSVCLLEQHDQAGGCLHTFAEKNYEFDVGLHYIGGGVGNRWSPVRKMFDAVTGGIVDWCKLDDP
jgi:all-trans-retinol 13,14-reductase